MIEKFNQFNLDENLLKAINNLGFKVPSKVQIEAIPFLLKKQDIIVKSQTGSGKTASFGIPICEHINIENSAVQAIILVPTRELALQVKEEIGNIGRLKKVRCAAVFGKQPFNDQVRELKQRVHVVVGTPGRLQDHINRGNLILDNVRFLVIDEADKMLNMGFIDQVKEILNCIKNDKTTALFSATIPEEINDLCKDYMKNAEILKIDSNILSEGNISEKFINVENEEKNLILVDLLYSQSPEAAIVFCNTKEMVKKVFESLKRKHILTAQIHGDMDQEDRIKTMERFKNKEFKVLVATDVAARGIHIDHITHVFNYEVPQERESYVHRIGRTGRKGQKGDAISLVSKRDKKFLEQIEDYVGHTIECIESPSNEDVMKGKQIFEESQKKFANKTGVEKKKVHSDVVKIHINGGKKKKIRALDILGCFSNLDDLTGDDIGIIDIQDGFSYVDILNGKGIKILKKYKEVSIKGKKVAIQAAKK
ncbi:DEAD/DEAH box helicase [Clostridium cylindrosporum]|uniref:ATP-dependent RNA helicase DbpA n=1 Tax=Clostridium cylindrosporum DSM 605 TaxID=1121307 RepID=A0A0J8DG81_CLOCY|nr:DEAD/DEAH box helicase [Clostridium cylindrosporum]KMT23178.1 ATP-dependent RNA helicase DbpA [Clostridium cylindrosporum DSM 605]